MRNFWICSKVRVALTLDRHKFALVAAMEEELSWCWSD